MAILKMATTNVVNPTHKAKVIIKYAFIIIY